ncbi:MAG: 3-deoxy-D-manno-octulosonic acid kinase [Gammaproteobacteria bacterium]|nr:3-deoxy-D-manno-octulosonic acid kinase [Gammaproteobacteria bacterium]
MRPVECFIENQHILYDADALSETDTGIFDPGILQARGLLTGSAPGRGTTWFFVHHDQPLVLRHYRRGGLAAGLLHDRYVWTGLARTRAWREFHLLAHILNTGLPVPQPVAVRVLRAGPYYRADLITRRIMFTASLAAALTTRGLDVTRWRTLGITLRKFHDAGIYHADLNAHNILLGKDNSLYVADFDKGELREPAARWQQENLARLHRSLKKLKSAGPDFYFGEADWISLLDAYHNTAST